MRVAARPGWPGRRRVWALLARGVVRHRRRSRRRPAATPASPTTPPSPGRARSSPAWWRPTWCVSRPGRRVLAARPARAAAAVAAPVALGGLAPLWHGTTLGSPGLFRGVTALNALLTVVVVVAVTLPGGPLAPGAGGMAAAAGRQGQLRRLPAALAGVPGARRRAHRDRAARPALRPAAGGHAGAGRASYVLVESPVRFRVRCRAGGWRPAWARRRWGRPCWSPPSRARPAGDGWGWRRRGRGLDDRRHRPARPGCSCWATRWPGRWGRRSARGTRPTPATSSPSRATRPSAARSEATTRRCGCSAATGRRGRVPGLARRPAPGRGPGRRRRRGVHERCVRAGGAADRRRAGPHRPARLRPLAARAPGRARRPDGDARACRCCGRRSPTSGCTTAATRPVRGTTSTATTPPGSTGSTSWWARWWRAGRASASSTSRAGPRPCPAARSPRPCATARTTPGARPSRWGVAGTAGPGGDDRARGPAPTAPRLRRRRWPWCSACAARNGAGLRPVRLRAACLPLLAALVAVALTCAARRAGAGRARSGTPGRDGVGRLSA